VKGFPVLSKEEQFKIIEGAGYRPGRYHIKDALAEHFGVASGGYQPGKDDTL